MKTENGAKTVYTYNALNQLVKENDAVYKYDDAGNLISTTSADKSATYTYNAENKLIRATVQEGNNVSVEEYEYDYAGNRISKTTGTETVTYLNDNSVLTNVLAEFDADGNEKCWYTRGIEIISQERNGDISYYLTDGHGSVRQLSDSTCAITDTYVYDAWGNLISSTGNTENSYLYCGEQLDSTTGLYYLRARYMNPSTGTFITMDTYQGTIFDPTSLHKYLYANANPVTYCDPSGYTASMAEHKSAMAISNIIASAASKAASFALGFYRAFKAGFIIGTSVITPVTLLFGDLILEMIADGVITSADANEAVREEIRKRNKPSNIGWIVYGELDSLGRATGAVAKITQCMPSVGLNVPSKIKPSGFINGKSLSNGGAGHARGHLIARQLGGDGTDPRNVVTLYQNPVNNSSMKKAENQIRIKRDLGETIYLSVIPLYINNEAMPHSIRMIAYGNRGYRLDINILNNLEGTVIDYGYFK